MHATTRLLLSMLLIPDAAAARQDLQARMLDHAAVQKSRQFAGIGWSQYT
jgi:hypothetical protein